MFKLKEILKECNHQNKIKEEEVELPADLIEYLENLLKDPVYNQDEDQEQLNEFIDKTVDKNDLLVNLKKMKAFKYYKMELSENEARDRLKVGGERVDREMWGQVIEEANRIHEGANYCIRDFD